MAEGDGESDPLAVDLSLNRTALVACLGAAGRPAARRQHSLSSSRPREIRRKAARARERFGDRSVSVLQGRASRELLVLGSAGPRSRPSSGLNACQQGD